MKNIKNTENIDIDELLKKKVTFEYLDADFKLAEPSSIQKNDRIKSYVDIYDNAKNNDSNPNTVLDMDRRSTYKSRLFKKIALKYIPKLEVPLIVNNNLFTLSRIDEEKINSNNVSVAQDLLNHQWNRSLNKVKIINKAARNFYIEGTAILKVGWDIEVVREKIKTRVISYAQNESEIKEAFNKAENIKDNGLTLNAISKIYEEQGKVPKGYTDKITSKLVVKKNQPSVKVVDNLSILIDPYCNGDISEANFVIEVYEISLSSLNANKDRYFNLDKVKEEMPKDYNYEFNSRYSDSDRDIKYDDNSITNNDYFDKNKIKLTMKEYWGFVDIDDDGLIIPIVASWIGTTLVRLEKSPFDKLPYCLSVYDPVSYSVFGESKAELLRDDQDGLTLTHRAMQNTAVKNAEQQDFINSRFISDITQKKNYQDGKTVYFNGNIDPRLGIYTKATEPVPDVLFQMKDIYDREAMKLESQYNNGETKSVDVFGASYQNDGSDALELTVLTRFMKMFEDMGRLIVDLNKKYSLSTDTYQDKDENWRQLHDVGVLTGIYDVLIKVTTTEMKLAKAARLMSIMSSSNSQNMDEDIIALNYIKITELLDEKGLSKKARELSIDKEPTEQEQEMSQLDIEHAKLEVEKVKLEIAKITSASKLDEARFEEQISRATERLYRIREGNIDKETELMEARSKTAISEANKLEEQTKLFAETLNYKTSGKEREDAEIDAEFQHKANLERESVRTERELTLLEKKKDENNDGAVSKEENRNYLVNMIKEKTLKNDSYDEADHVYRNIDKYSSNNTLLGDEQYADATTETTTDATTETEGDINAI